jgi:hypothetical protein
MPFYDQLRITKFGTINTAVAPSEIKTEECQDVVNAHQPNAGWWQGRNGSKGHTFSNTNYADEYFPYEAKLIHEYQTEKGTPADDKPGVTTNGDTYILLFVTTDDDSNGTGGIYLRRVSDWAVASTTDGTTIDPEIDTGKPLIRQYLDQANTAKYFVAEPDIIKRAETAHGRVIVPLMENGNVEVWVANDVWYCRRVALHDFPIDLVRVDLCLTTDNAGAVSAPLTLMPWKSVKSAAIKATDAGITDDAGGYNGNGDKPIIVRADGDGGALYDDVAKDPIRDANQSPVVVEAVPMPYKLRYSPSTAIDTASGKVWYYASKADEFYRPKDQVKGFDKSPSGAEKIPHTGWRYRFVWDYGNGRYSNASADMEVGDALWSVLDDDTATALHADWARQSQYAEPTSGLVGTTLSAPITATDTDLPVVDSAVFRTPPPPGASVSPPGIAIDCTRMCIVEGDTVDWVDVTGIGVGTLTVRDRPGGSHAFTAAAKVLAYYDVDSTIDPVSSFGAAAETALRSLKTLIYPSGFTHRDNDVFITVRIDKEDATGVFLQRDVGYVPWAGGQDAGITEPTAAVRNVALPCVFGMGSNFDPVTGAVRQHLGYTLETRGHDLSDVMVEANKASANAGGPTINGDGVRVAYPTYGQDDSAVYDGAHPDKEAMFFQLPNICRVTDDASDLDRVSPEVAPGLAWLFQEGKYDWTFFKTASELQVNGASLRIYWQTLGGAIDNYRANVKSQYEGRMLLRAKRLLWDWQLSQLWPSSILFDAPRIRLVLDGDTVRATGAARLLIFRTLNSRKPSFSASEFALVDTVDVPIAGDLSFFDATKDIDLDQNIGGKPEDYEGERFGVHSKYIRRMGDERIVYGNIKHTYWPFAPRGMVPNVIDATNPENTSFVLAAVDAAYLPALSNPFEAVTYGTFAYNVRFRDMQGIAGEDKLGIEPRDWRTGDTDFFVVGMFMPCGYNGSIKELDIYRVDTDSPDGPYLYRTVKPSDCGIFVDGKFSEKGEKWVASEGKLVVDGHGVLYTEPLRPEFIPPTNLQEVSFGDGDEITGLARQQSNLVIFKRVSMHRMFMDTRLKDPGAERIELPDGEEGCIAPHTLIEHEGLLIYYSLKGVRFFDGTSSHSLDVHVYNDLQALARLPESKDYTGYYYPRYGEYVIEINRPATTTIVSLARAVSDTGDELSITGTALFPPVPFTFTISDGINTDYGATSEFASWDVFLSYATAAVVRWQGANYRSLVDDNMGNLPSNAGFWSKENVYSMRREGTKHEFLPGDTVTITVNPYPYAYVFDLSDWEFGGAGLKGVITSRYQYQNKKLFLPTRSGMLLSTIFSNPGIGSARSTAAIIEEDSDIATDFAQTGYKDYEERGLKYLFSWTSKLFTAQQSVRQKRMRFVRIRCEHYNALTAVFAPLAMTMHTVMSGAMDSNTADSLTRYHNALAAGGVATDDNVLFVSLDADRGLDVYFTVSAPAYKLRLKEFEADLRVLRLMQ